VKLGKLFTRGVVKNINEEAKTFDVVFATETPVYRRGWEESYNEILSCLKDHIRSARLDEGVVPLLDNHNRYEGVSKQYGIVQSWRIDNGECKATIQFSTREEFTGIWNDIKAGIIKSISVGYNVFKYVRELVGDGQTPNYRATDWEPLEISLAPVPADYKSSIRSEQENDLHEVEVINPLSQNRNSNMFEDNKENGTQTAPVTTDNRAQGTITAPVTVDAEKIRKEAIEAERKRTTDIQDAVRSVGLEDEFARTLINGGNTIEEARTAIINKLAETQNTPGVRATGSAIVTGQDEADQVREAMSLAIQHRAEPGSVQLTERAQDFKGMKLVDMARHCLERSGEKNTFRYSTNEMVKRAISTTDYPELLTSTVSRQLRRFFSSTTSNWQFLGQRTTVSDFRAKTGLQVDGKVTFEKITEGGEYKATKILQDRKASISVDTYGRLVKITRQAIINDDLDVFSRIPKMFATGAAELQSEMFWSMITGNAKTPDGKTIFHADHNNIMQAGAISEATLNAAIIAMLKQKSPAGQRQRLRPKYLIVPVELELTAKKIMTAITANKTGDVNVFNGAFEIVSEILLSENSASRWYMAADPSSVEGLLYAYLDGEEGLYTESRTNFDDDTVETKARMEFGVAAWEHLGWLTNPGQ
jgi:phage major head subunit gpT-like protein